MQDLNTCVVYQHRKLNNSEIFYIGIGKTEKRAFQKHGRNRHWKYIVLKNDYIVEILHKNLSWEEACKIEKDLIKFYGRQDNKTGILCNMTDGGEGTLGRSMTEKNKKLFIERIKGNTYGKGQIKTQKQIETIIRLNKERVFTPEKLEKMKQLRLGYKPTLETIEKIKKGLKGKYHNQRLVLNLETGIYYDSSKEAFLTTNKIPWSSFRCMLLGKKMKNKTTFIYC